MTSFSAELSNPQNLSFEIMLRINIQEGAESFAMSCESVLEVL